MSLFEIGDRIDRLGILADFEMQLWPTGLATHARKRHNLASGDIVTALDDQFTGMAINTDQSIVVTAPNWFMT